MIALTLVTTYLLCLALATATAKGSRSPVAMTERGSAVLVWLEHNQKPGTPRTRALVQGRFRSLVWRGLKLAGVAWLDRRTGDIDMPRPGHRGSPFGCIHQHEGSWTERNYPYGGGLQEDTGFQSTYGSEFIQLWGSAGNWPIWSQVLAGYRAWHGYHGFGARGYTPWPNTARMCGLL